MSMFCVMIDGYHSIHGYSDIAPLICGSLVHVPTNVIFIPERVLIYIYIYIRERGSVLYLGMATETLNLR